MKIVLFQPEIPQNAGNIARTCSITGTGLVFVRPLGFQITNRYLKRAGLDYWDDLDIEYTSNLEEYLIQSKKPFYFFSSKGKKNYTEISFEPDALLIFGSETSGLPQHYHDQYADHFYTIPMMPNKRSLNLANSACIVLYEGLRQGNFQSLKESSGLCLQDCKG